MPLGGLAYLELVFSVLVRPGARSSSPQCDKKLFPDTRGIRVVVHQRDGNSSGSMCGGGKSGSERGVCVCGVRVWQLAILLPTLLVTYQMQN